LFDFVPGPPITENFQIDLSQVDEVSMTTTVTLQTLTELFDKVLGKRPPHVSELAVTGIF
jgi:hypothetical protein